MQPAYRQFPQQQVPPRTPHSSGPRRGGGIGCNTRRNGDKWKKPGLGSAPPVRSSRFDTNTL
ncbi:hypothetical protein PG994_001843 [Apiospora phragmitis]|uniref:Uncharacterized protein n=1 Tax=Apiospora phragmitis TaxID=2905665 RepID=A0ABR1WUQ1_9PEZI